MKSLARRYIEKRNRALDSSSSTRPLNTDLSGVTVAEQKAKIQEQQRSDETARMTSQGLVPVSAELSNLARACGVEVLRDDEATFGSPHHWVPAWFLAAHQGYRGAPGMLGAPTREFEQYIRGLIVDPREQVLLVAEFQLTAPFQEASTVIGFQNWLALHGRDL